MVVLLGSYDSDKITAHANIGSESIKLSWMKPLQANFFLLINLYEVVFS
jgi:hypothetical protein